MMQDFHKYFTVLATAYPDKNVIIFPDHIVIRYSRTGKPANLFEKAVLFLSGLAAIKLLIP